MNILSYRGYKLYSGGPFGVLITHVSDPVEPIDSAPTVAEAKDLIDSWLNAV